MGHAPNIVNDRYEVVRTLGKGGMGQVFLVRDLLHPKRAQVALKLLEIKESEKPQVLSWFKREFRTLTMLRHPGLASVYDFGRDQNSGKPFYTADYVEGVDLFHKCQTLSMDHKLRLLLRIGQVVDYIHSKGVVHNDLKPGNILVSEKTQLPVLVDFGLSQICQPELDDKQKKKEKKYTVRGTPSYLAPEIIAGEPPSFQSDLFSLGMVFYKICAGQAPFEEKSSGEILSAHLKGNFPPPRQFNPAISESLEDLILSLLALKPADRPQMAQEVNQQLSLIAGVNQGALTQEEVFSYAESVPLIGRERHLRLLRNFVQQKIPKIRDSLAKDSTTSFFEISVEGVTPQPQQSRFAIVTGHAGSGKTALLSALKHRFQLKEIPFISVECLHRPTIFAVWNRVFRELFPFVRQSARLSDGEKTFLENLVEEKELLDLGQLNRSSFFVKITRILAAVFDEHPFILSFDDVEKADSLSQAFFKHLDQLRRHQSLPPMIVSTLHPDWADLVFSADHNQRLSLESFSVNQCQEYLSEAFRPQPPPDRIVQGFFDHSEGNPRFLKEILRHVISEEVLTRIHGEWNLKALDMQKVRLPLSLLEIYEEQFRKSNALQRELLSYMLVFGEPALLKELATFVHKDASEVQEALRMLEEQEFVRQKERHLWVLEHPAFNDVIVKHLKDKAKKHRVCGEYLRGITPQPVERLALHFSEGEKPALAASFALKSAGNAQNIFAHERAIELFRLAIRESEKRKDAKRKPDEVNALLGEAEVLWQTGKRRDALTVYERLLRAADSGEFLELRLTAWRALGIAKRDKGDFQGAIKIFTDAQAETEGVAAIRSAQLSAQIAFAYARSGDFDLAAKWVQKCKESLPAKRGEELAKSAILVVLAGTASLCDFTDEAKRLYEEAHSISAKKKDRRGCAIALNNLGALAFREGKYDDALKAVEGSLKLSRTIGDVTRVANALNNLAHLYYLQGRYREAAKHYQEGSELALDLNDWHLVAKIFTALGQLETDRGNCSLAKEYLDKGQEFRRELKDRVGLAVSFLGYANLYNTVGLREEALRYVEHALKRADTDELRLRILLQAFASRIHQESRSEAEKVVLEIERLRTKVQSPELVCGFHLLQTQFFHSCGDLAEAEGTLDVLPALLEKVELPGLRLIYQYWKYRLQAARFGKNPKAGEINECLKNVERLQKDLRGFEDVHLQIETDALLAEVLERAGKEKDAAKLYRSCCTRIEDLAKPLEHEWRTAFVDVPDRKQILDRVKELEGSDAFASIELGQVKQKLSQVDRLLEINHYLITGWKDRTRLLEYIVDVGLDLSQAKRGFVVLGQNGSLEVEVARNVDQSNQWQPDNAFSRSIVREVVTSGLPQVLLDASREPHYRESDSVYDLGLRSVLCVPLRLGSKILGALYLDHDRDTGLFDKPVVDLLLALGDQASLALQQAETFALFKRNAEETSIELTRARALLAQQNKDLQWRYSYANIVGGRDVKMRKVFDLLDRVIPTQIPVLIQGESGTGKELVCKAIHYNGPRKTRPLVSINCASLNPNLVESELFGHVRGAFTGADNQKDGLFTLAHGGTLFLDEVADLSPEVQAKLLRAIQEKEIQPLGSEKTLRVDVRIVSATNKPLDMLVEQGAFREDLFYRLNGVQIDLPALRERGEDIDLLIDHFLVHLAEAKGGKGKILTSAARKLLRNYYWPGNVREMYATLESVFALHSRKKIDVKDLPERIRNVFSQKMSEIPELKDAQDIFTRDYLQKLLRLTGGNISQAAEKAGVYRQNLHRMLKRLGIRTDRPELNAQPEKN